MTAFSHFDPLLLLPVMPRKGLLVGPASDHDRLAEAFGHFERIQDLTAPGPPADALVALEWQCSLSELLAGAGARLGPEGMLLARLANRQLPGAIARHLFPGLEPAGPLACPGKLKRALTRAGFAAHALYAWLPSESFPYVIYPIQERQMQRFYLERLMPTWGLKSRIFSRCAGWLPPTLLAPCFLMVARKGG